MPLGFELPDVDMRDKADRIAGLGVEKRFKENNVEKILKNEKMNLNKLQGMGEDEMKYLD